MKTGKSLKLNSVKFALAGAIIMAFVAFSSTILTLISPLFSTITPLFHLLYGNIGYSISFLGSLIGAAYSFIDTFIIIYVFAWIYNKIS